MFSGMTQNEKRNEIRKEEKGREGKGEVKRKIQHFIVNV